MAMKYGKEEITAYRTVVRGKDMNPLLFDLLSRATPHGHEDRLLDLFPEGYYKDKIGNLIYFKGDKQKHRTVFCSHMDTVHTKAEDLILLEKLEGGKPSGMIYAGTKEQEASVLGGDDKLGVYIMLRMMEHGIPGVYIFHVGEECGCIGSNWLLKNRATILKNVDRAISFDRMYYGDIINYQHGQRCCSEEFVKALAEQINPLLPPKTKMSGTRGVYTDSAVYMNVIPECTNISVGNFRQHTTDEHFDHVWLESMLIPALFKVEWHKLPTKRDPSKKEMEPYSYSTKVNTAVTNIYHSWGTITNLTEWRHIPYWDITKGIPDGATRVGVLALLSKKIASVGFDAMTRDVFSLMEARTKNEAEIKKLKEELLEKEQEILAMVNYADRYYDEPPTNLIN